MEEFNMTLNKYLDIAPEVQKALEEGRPVVALESTIISHGMPYPQNVETALNVEKIIRENGAVPATIAVIGGRLKAGLSEAEIDYLGKTGTAVAKASRRDLPVLVAEGKDGATTVTTTMIIAHMAGIQVFATGGIGGVHRGAQQTFDISADLEELAGGRAIRCVVVDPSAASFIETLRRKGWQVMKADNDVADGIRVTADLLRQRRIVLCRPCRDCLRELAQYCWDEKAGKDAPRKEHDHAMDEMRYFAMDLAGERSGGFAAISVVRKI